MRVSEIDRLHADMQRVCPKCKARSGKPCIKRLITGRVCRWDRVVPIKGYVHKERRSKADELIERGFMDAKMSTDEVVAEIDKAFKRGGRQGWSEGFTAGVRWAWSAQSSDPETPPNPYDTPKEESL